MDMQYQQLLLRMKKNAKIETQWCTNKEQRRNVDFKQNN
jgi:hypothetical protein